MLRPIASRHDDDDDDDDDDGKRAKTSLMGIGVWLLTVMHIV